MKILIVTPHFWPENFPINEWAKELINHGYKVQVLTGKPNYPGGEIYKKYQPRKFKITQHYYEKIEIISIPVIPRGNGSTFRLLLNYLSFVFSFLIFLPKILNKTDFNVIFYYGITPLTASIPAIILNKIKKKKLLIWVQDLWPESIAFTGHIKNIFILKILNYFCIKIYSSADVLLCQSKSFLSYLKKKIRKKNIYLLYNGFPEIKNKKKIKINKKIKNILDKHFCITYGGNIGKAQNFYNILMVAKKILHIKKIKFLIIGSGSDFYDIKNKIKSLKLKNVYLFPMVNKYQINHIFHKSKALILSLKKNIFLSKTIPSKLQNYLAIGKPLLISADGEVNNLIKKNNCGLTSPAEDCFVLKKNIIKIFQKRKNLYFSKNAKKLYIDQFQIKNNIKNLIKYL
jgi:hypothetical protein